MPRRFYEKEYNMNNCPLIERIRKDATYDMYGKLINISYEERCRITGATCMRCTEVMINNRNNETKITRYLPSYRDTYIIKEGEVTRHE